MWHTSDTWEDSNKWKCGTYKIFESEVTNGNVAYTKYLVATVTSENGTQINVKKWECLLTFRSGFLLPGFYIEL